MIYLRQYHQLILSSMLKFFSYSFFPSLVSRLSTSPNMHREEILFFPEGTDSKLTPLTQAGTLNFYEYLYHRYRGRERWNKFSFILAPDAQSCVSGILQMGGTIIITSRELPARTMSNQVIYFYRPAGNPRKCQALCSTNTNVTIKIPIS